MNKPTFLTLALLSTLTVHSFITASEGRATPPADVTTCNITRVCPGCGQSDVVPFTKLTELEQAEVLKMHQEKLKQARKKKTDQWVLGILTTAAVTGTVMYQRMSDTQTNDPHASETLQDWFSELLGYKA